MCPESSQVPALQRLFEHLIAIFLDKLTAAQRKLLRQSDCPPYYSSARQAIVFECEDEWVFDAISQQEDLIVIAKNLGVRVEAVFVAEAMEQEQPEPDQV
ncbi:MAG: hypothetical protein SFY66_19605 [Oculatellaceae cyanobacterium bins.114]|nr:hypothetical protein [Oculatellaceae cyanobacterium bins.114]